MGESLRNCRRQRALTNINDKTVAILGRISLQMYVGQKSTYHVIIPFSTVYSVTELRIWSSLDN